MRARRRRGRGRADGATLRASFAAVAASFAGASAFEDACHAFVSGGFWDESQNGETHTIEKPLRDAVNETKGARRLFDREADNHHAEGLLLAQLAARAVAEVPGTVTKQFAAARLIGTARALAAAARTLASTHEDDDDEASGKAFFPGWAGARPITARRSKREPRVSGALGVRARRGRGRACGRARGYKTGTCY